MNGELAELSTNGVHATTVETAGRYSFLDHDVPVGGGPLPHVHEKADEWFYVLQGNPVVHVDYRTFTLAEGDFVHIPMGTTHWFEVLADQGARRILSSRRGARLHVGPGGRRTKHTHTGTDRCVRVPTAVYGGSELLIFVRPKRHRELS